MTLKDDLKAIFDRSPAAPFLFIGSGLSRRYLDLETWDALLRRFADGAAHPYEYYRSKANGDLAAVASLLAEEYHELWWTKPEFEQHRKQYAKFATTSSSALKIEIAAYIASKTLTNNLPPNFEPEIKHLGQATIDGIITTNWDTALESIFPDFQTYVGQQQILIAHPQGIAEVYKIHGSVSDPNSLVLTTEDYAQFAAQNPYLTAKLLTIFVEHPVIFLGYSISDPNVQGVLRQLAACLSPESIRRLTDRLILAERDTSATGGSIQSTVVTAGGQNIPITLVRTDDFGEIYRALGDRPRRLSARILRILKEQIYELVETNDPQGKMHVLDIEKAAAANYKDVEIVYGVGVLGQIGKVGYVGIDVTDLLNDVLDNGTGYDPARIVREVIPRLIRSPSKSVPVFKYLREYGAFAENGDLIATDLNPSVVERVKAAQKQSYFYPPHHYSTKQLAIQATYSGVGDIAARLSPERAIYVIPLLREDQLNVDELRTFLLQNRVLLNTDKPNDRTYYRRLVSMYDWLVHRRSVLGKGK